MLNIRCLNLKIVFIPQIFYVQYPKAKQCLTGYRHILYSGQSVKLFSGKLFSHFVVYYASLSSLNVFVLLSMQRTVVFSRPVAVSWSPTSFSHDLHLLKKPYECLKYNILPLYFDYVIDQQSVSVETVWLSVQTNSHAHKSSQTLIY